jgi:hypothetical protein
MYADFICYEENKNCIFNFRICCFCTIHIFEQLLFLNNGDFSQIFFTGKKTTFFFTFLDNWMTKKFLNDCVLFLNNYYEYIDFICDQENKSCIFNFRICCFPTTHIFEQLLFLNNGDFHRFFFYRKGQLDNCLIYEQSAFFKDFIQRKRGKDFSILEFVSGHPDHR